MAAISNDWLGPLTPEFRKPYYAKLYQTIREEYNSRQIFPNADDIFNAFSFTPLSDVKAVILGQDPYHNDGQAHGLCFSVKPDVDVPPSLVNIYKELNEDLGCYIPNHGCLEKWAKQGVLLLNASLTVRDGEANSHKGKGWEKVTDKITTILNNRREPVIFILWGNDAKKKEELITAPQHIILSAAHPSPLSASRGFFGCGHFKKVNNILTAMNQKPIDWQIENV